MKSPLAAAAAVCELCHHKQPSLYCCSDQAFLCLDCDTQVHTANFLVARHIRIPIRISNYDDDSFSTTKTSSTTTSVDWKTRDLLMSWCSRLGVSSKVVDEARHAFQVWWVNRSEWPYRVGLAASLWLALTKDTSKRKIMRTLLKRLEEISGVPAKSIVVEQLKLVGMLKRQRQRQHKEESWAEC
ncbi:B-box zinc finger protein 32-like [Bidens hawaiensis]|uniref:B-box zinc finger protein 32-like n=1 Tax=Bidens hawaiensis TaxID=980011 RepID=UPI00404B38AC